MTPWPAEGLEETGRCPVCTSAYREVMHEALTDLAFGCAPGFWRMWRCGACASGYLDPRPELSHIGLAYAAYYTHAPMADGAVAGGATGLAGKLRRGLANAYVNARFGAALAPAMPFGARLIGMMGEARVALDHRYRHIAPLPLGGGTLLDVGCGSGNFLILARELGWQVEGVEPDPAAVDVARAARLMVHAGMIDSLAEREQEFDQITISHVIEHVHDPLALLTAAHRLLKPGGRIFVETPNVSGLGHARFGAAWRGLEAPRHLQVFSHAALHQLMARAGFASLADMPAPDPSPLLDAESEAMARKAGIEWGSPQPQATLPYAQRSPASREFLTVTGVRAQ